MVLRLSVAVSLVALVALAGLQYQWIGQIAVAERQRLEHSVAESSEEFAEDFSNEVRGLTLILEPRPAFPTDPESVAMRFKEWAATAAYPNLLKNLYLAQSPSVVLRLDKAEGVFEAASWPPHLSAVAEFVSRQSAPPLDLDADVMLIPLDRRFAGPGRGRNFRGPGGPPGFEPGPVRGGSPPQDPEDDRWIVAELNHEVLTTQILPALVVRRFPDYENQAYRVAVVAHRRGDIREPVFTSGEVWSAGDLATPDYQLDLLGPVVPRRPPGAGGPPQDSLSGPPPSDRGGPRGGDRGFRGGGERRGSFTTFAGQGWRLLVKHRAGSVEIAAMQFRRRNLAISFGVLVVLGVGAVAMVVSGSRARRLGKLQMEFAAGVSHELRTPLAVIQSAAHNLGSGVVQNREDIEEYAAIVQTEARRLTEMVEQVMTYTETQSGRKRYQVAPVDTADVADISIKNMSSVLREGNATVEKRFEPGLPPVMADAQALTRCLQNLLSNAVKYGRSNYSAQIVVEGRFLAVPGSPGKVELSVIDRGLGVPETDVRHLFEAFYRGSNASTNTPGNGLGLHLVQRIMQAQSGTVAYARSDDGGARFMLSLPIASRSV